MNDPSYYPLLYPLLRPPPDRTSAPPPDERTDAPPADDGTPAGAPR